MQLLTVGKTFVSIQKLESIYLVNRWIFGDLIPEQGFYWLIK
jgi:hypothetical protein